MSRERQLLANQKYNNKVRSGELNLVKARLTKLQKDCVDQLKLEKDLSTSSQALKHIITDYFNLPMETGIKTPKVHGETSSIKVENLNTEIGKLKQKVHNLTEENRLLQLKLSNLPFEEKLKNYSKSIPHKALDDIETEPAEYYPSLGELHVLCSGIPKDIVNFYQNELYKLVDDLILNGR